MRDIILHRIETRFQSLFELVSLVTEEQLREKVPVPKNKSLQEHFWCLVGARESYTQALAKGAWSGFSCSLTELDRQAIKAKLYASAEQFKQVTGQITGWNPARDELLLALLEHEVMHEGQIIRHMYALGYTLPESWKWA